MKTHRSRTVSIGIVTVAAILVGLGIGLAWGMGARPPVVGMPAHEFSLPNLSGQAQSLSQYRGKIVLLNFWATWCKPCTTEMPAMQAAYERFQDRDFVVLAIH